MKILLIVTLALNLIVEGLASATLILGPDGIAASGQGGQWSMHYGFAVLAIATAGIWIWPHRTNLAALTAVLGILTVFHVGLFVSLSIAGDQQAGMFIHAVLSVLCAILLVSRKKLADT